MFENVSNVKLFEEKSFYLPCLSNPRLYELEERGRIRVNESYCVKVNNLLKTSCSLTKPNVLYVSKEVRARSYLSSTVTTIIYAS